MFDTIEEKSNNEETNHQPEETKSEPVFQSQTNRDEYSKDETETTEDDFQNEGVEIDDEFNQESEEELLDIPTFLRRQAN